LPKRAANKPPATNTHALDRPAKQRWSSKGSACVKKPLKPMNTLVNTAPAMNTCTASQRRSMRGKAMAPSK